MNTPYYQNDNVTIWHGDARTLPIEDKSVHLIVTSPPYNAGIKYDVYNDRQAWDEYWRLLIEPSLRECYRVLVDSGRICVNLANVARAYGPDCQPSTVPPMLLAPRVWQLLEEVGFLPRDQITWIKGEQEDPAETATASTAWGTWRSPRNPVLRAVTEPIFIASKGTHRREPGESDLTADEFKAWSRNAWSIGRGARSWHPSAFPIELPRRLIKMYSYVGDVVLDSFVGSGTTLAAAALTHRRGVGIEVSEEYCRRSADRVQRIYDEEAQAAG